jgi:GcrA cell cycle regulator
VRNPWPEQDVTFLKRRWEEGATDSQIARELNGRYTRNAVIGQRHRAGWIGRQVAKRAPVPRVSKIKHAIGQGKRTDHAKPTPYTPPVIADAPGQKCPIVEVTTVESSLTWLTDHGHGGNIAIDGLNPHHCRWPTWSNTESGGMYCGAKRLEGHPYCGPHCGVAYTAKTGPRRVWKTWERRK